MNLSVSSNSTNPVKSFIEISFSFFMIVGLLIFSGYILSFYPIQQPPLEELKELFIPRWKGHVAPKPKEHFIYISLLLLLPLLVFISILYIKNRFQEIVNIPRSFSIATILIFPVLISFPFLYDADYIKTLVGEIGIGQILLTFFVTTLLYYFKGHFSNRKWMLLTAFSISVIAIFQVFAFRVAPINLVFEDGAGAWAAHFQAVFYSVTQVVGGKIILSDLPAQYGLYPELLKPIFLLMGLSILKFTMVLGVLQLVGTASLFAVLLKFIKNKILCFVFMVCLSIITCLTWILFKGYWEPLFQISPMRLVFPALSVFLFTFIAKDPTIKKVFLFSLISGLALIWNLDSGVPIYGAFLCYLSSLFIFPNNVLTRFNSFKLVFIASIIPLSVYLLFIVYLQVKSNSPLNLMDITKYQNIFYVTGFAMLPIARGFSPWQVICSIYVLGLTIPVYGWIKGFRTKRWDTVFYLSILGLGLFSYHEGRSHTWTLLAVSWPAFMISFIVCDYILRLVIVRKIPAAFSATCYPVIFLGVLLTTTFFRGIPTLYKYAGKHWEAIVQAPGTLVTQNIDFIKSRVKDDKEAIIISPLQSAYYGETRLTSPLKGPGYIEIILQSDMDAMLNQLMNHPHKHLFVQLNDSLEIPDESLYLLKNYKVVEKNKTMAYLTSIEN